MYAEDIALVCMFFPGPGVYVVPARGVYVLQVLNKRRSKKMKRYNIHLSEDNIKKLDELLPKIQKSGSSWSISHLKRADLIRYAIAKTFNCEFVSSSYSCVDIGGIDKAIKKALKGGKK